MKKTLSWILVLALLLGMMPVHAISAGVTETVEVTGYSDLMHIICYGQSFSVGADAPGYADPLVDGTYVLGSVTGSTAGDDLRPLQLTSGTQHPIVTAVNSLAQMLKADGIRTDLIAGSYGSGGKTIAQLMSAERQTQIKTEEGYAYEIQSSGKYTVFENSVAAVADYAKKTERGVSCPAIVFLQGETDQNTDAQLGYPENPARAGYGAGGDKEKYKLYLARLKEDMQREVMEAYGQTEKPLFLIYQVSGTYVRTPYSSINMAQLEFAQENEDVILVQTPYFAPHYTNSHHLTVNGYRWLGEYIGQSIYTALTKQERTWPLLPQEFTVEDQRTLRITVSGAVDGLTIDTWTVEDATNSGNKYGFYLELNGTRVVPEVVTIDGNDIILTLPDGAVPFDRAQSIYVFYGGQKAKGTGNIRDNAANTGFYCYLDDSADAGTGNNQGVSHSALDGDGNSLIGQPYPLYNWLASFCYKIPGADPQKGAAYHWEMQDAGLVSVANEQMDINNLTLLQGAVENGILKNVQYEMEKTVVLYHDRPWSIEWKSEGNGGSYGGGKILSAAKNSGSKVSYLYMPADSRGFLAWGVPGESRNYGIKLGSLGINTREEHIYRIENRIAADGTNTVYLIVDGAEIGDMNTPYSTKDGSQINETKNWADGTDIYLSYIGEPTNFLVNNLKLQYLAVSEGEHVHRYETVTTAPTCTEKGYTTYTCDCGDEYVDSYVEATGHSWGDWEMISESERQRSCTACGETEQEKISVLHGDANDDGGVNALDLILLRQYLAGWDVTISSAADANGDGTANALDLILLRQYLAGWDVTLGQKLQNP